jgi:uncharacterized membrane protein YuzA (DUF378 family)
MNWRIVDVIVAILGITGGLNWGLIGILNFDLVAWIFGDMTLGTRIIYTLVGVGALYQAIQWKALQFRWGQAKGVA